MILKIFTVFSITLSFGAWAQADSEPQTLFYEGVAAYNKSEWDRAHELLNQYLALRPNDARAHLNMATLETKRKHWGYAIAHLKRALALDPNIDGAQALNKVLAQNAPLGNGLSGPFHRVIRPFIASLNVFFVLALCALTFTAWGHFYISHLKKKKWATATGEPLPAMNWIVLLIGTLCVCSGVLFLTLLWVSKMNLGTVVKNTPVFSAPDASSFELGQLNEASEVQILSESGDWLQVSNQAELSGWINKLSLLKHRENP